MFLRYAFLYGKGLCFPPYLCVCGVEVGGWLVERENAAVEAERLCQGEANDQASQHLWGRWDR